MQSILLDIHPKVCRIPIILSFSMTLKPVTLQTPPLYMTCAYQFGSYFCCIIFNHISLFLANFIISSLVFLYFLGPYFLLIFGLFLAVVSDLWSELKFAFISMIFGNFWPVTGSLESIWYWIKSFLQLLVDFATWMTLKILNKLAPGLSRLV